MLVFPNYAKNYASTIDKGLLGMSYKKKNQYSNHKLQEMVKFLNESDKSRTNDNDKWGLH